MALPSFSINLDPAEPPSFSINLDPAELPPAALALSHEPLLVEAIKSLALPLGFIIDGVETDDVKLRVWVRDEGAGRRAPFVVFASELCHIGPHEFREMFQRKCGEAVALLRTAEEGLARQNRELRSELERHTEEREFSFRKSARYREALEKAVGFIGGLCLQDHPVALQREQRIMVQQLLVVLNPKAAGL